MKRKFSLMGRVAIALVLALSLSLVMAVPVSAAVSEAQVTVAPDNEGEIAQYTIAFTTSLDLSTTESDTITITFDAAYGDLTTLVPADVSVNEKACATVGVSAKVVTITVPKDIPAGDVTVVFSKGATVISNPTAGEYTLSVKTKREVADIPSASYTISEPILPEIVSVAGTAYQNSNDVIVITFSKPVEPVSNWITSFPSEDAILCGTTELVLTGADFSPAAGNLTETLTITLAEANAYLVIGQTLKVTPVASQIKDAVPVPNFVPSVEKTGLISGDSVDPTVALTYSFARPVRDDDTLTITATFSEAMQANPTIAIATQGDGDLSATAMSLTSSKVWKLEGWNVPAGADEDGTATVTINGTDLAGNANQAATNNTFVIDNTAPTITSIVGKTIEGADDTIVITFNEAIATPATWTVSAFGSIECGTTDVLTGASFEYDEDSDALTVTIAESDSLYLVNDETITVVPASDAIKDEAGNALSVDPDDPDTGLVNDPANDAAVPTITLVVGTILGGEDTIAITFSEAVVTADGEVWGAGEFLVESPDGAPLNINNAKFDYSSGVLTITLDIAKDGASLALNKVVCVTPAENAILDHAGNAVVSSQVSSLAVGVALYDDSDTYVDSYSTIQKAIDAAFEGYTIVVGPGTYEESISITEANLTLKSASGKESTTIVNKGGTISPEESQSGFLIRGMATNFTLGGEAGHGFTFSGGTAPRLIQLNNNPAGVEISYNKIDTTGTAEPHIGIQIGIAGATDLIVRNNTFTSGAGSFGVTGPNLVDVTVTYNNFSGVWDPEAPNVDIRTPAIFFIGVTGTSSTISNNTITLHGRGILLETGTGTSGVLISDNDISNSYVGIKFDQVDAVDMTTVTVTHNTLSTNVYGIQVVDGVNILASTFTIEYNNISGSTSFGLENVHSSEVVNAENNWWGTLIGSEIAEMVSAGQVDYTPWLNAAYPDGVPCAVVTLEEGWNLISVPLMLTDETIGTVMADLAIISVRTFKWEADVLGEEWWKPGVPASDLLKVVDGQGYWIEMSAADALVVVGSEYPAPGGRQPSYDLHVGWNLIGFKSLDTATNVLGYLGTAVNPNVQAMYGYDATAGTYFIPGVAPHTNLEPGCGYWLAVSAAGTIYP